MLFLPQEEQRAAELERLVASTVEAEGQAVLGWRDVPVDAAHVGSVAGACAPRVRHVFVAAAPELRHDQDAFERKLYVIRRTIELAAGPDLSIPSFSSRTLVYKGMLNALQLSRYYPDLVDPRLQTIVALVHSRYSTNTFPSWELAHPYRLLAHNGEINTLRGNVNWMKARESQLASGLFGEDLAKVLPVVRAGGSDSATFDNVLELLVLAGRSLPHAVMMMVPEAYEGRADLPPELTGFDAYHGCLMEPWDGPSLRSPSQMVASSARPSTETACDPAAGSRRRMAGSCSLPRPGCSTKRRRTSSARVGFSPGSSSSSTLSRAGFSRTRPSSDRSRAGGPMASGTSARSSGCPISRPRRHPRSCRRSRCAGSSSSSATRRTT